MLTISARLSDTCGQSGTGYTSRGNVIKSNRFEDVYHRPARVGGDLVPGSSQVHFADIENPQINALYFDDTVRSTLHVRILLDACS